jgi:hypothetical protein
MKRALIILAAMACFGAAHAADMPVKTKAFADPFAKGYPYTGCGAYYGIDTAGDGGKLNVSNAPGAATVQGEIGAVLGYSCAASASTFWFVESMFNFANLNGQAASLSLSGPASFEQRVAFGGPLSTMLNLFPTLNLPLPTLPVLPTGVTVTTTHPYLFVGVHEQDISATVGPASHGAWAFSPGFGVGMINQLSNNVAADVYTEAQLREKAICTLAIACANLGTTYRVGFSLKY